MSIALQIQLELRFFLHDGEKQHRKKLLNMREARHGKYFSRSREIDKFSIGDEIILLFYCDLISLFTFIITNFNGIPSLAEVEE